MMEYAGMNPGKLPLNLSPGSDPVIYILRVCYSSGVGVTIGDGVFVIPIPDSHGYNLCGDP